MAAIPGSIDTEQQPPMTVPLRHFVVGIGFLFAGAAVGFVTTNGVLPRFATLAHVHLLLVGWICVTIMGAMTQFVPVWSGVQLHSRRLSSLQLVLVVVGLGGFATALLLGELVWLPLFGASMLAGFWVFVYNIGRTMAAIDAYDVTERHFLLALAFFVVLTALGVLLATDITQGVLIDTPVTHVGVLKAHATLAVFGAVLTTIYGALYQLGTMFTQTELDAHDRRLQWIESIGHPVGVLLLAGGRLIDVASVAKVGGVLVAVAAVSFVVILARKLREMQVAWTPMHTRYAIAVPMLGTWGMLAGWAWVTDPLAYSALLGAAGSAHLLALGGIGFVVFGTLYHIVPFIIWVHRYSDLLGYEDVPMIDDLYDDRLAAVDATLLVTGTTSFVAAGLLNVPAVLFPVGGLLVALGIAVFATNMALVIYRHSPYSFAQVLFGRGWTRSEPTETSVQE